MYQVPPGPLSQETAVKLTKLLQEYQSGLIDLNPSFIGASAPDYRGGSYTANLVPNEAFPVKLTAVSGGLYSWTEQYSTGTTYADWRALPGGRTGTNTTRPAFEPNGVAIGVSGSPVVWIGRAYYDVALDWVYVILGTVDSGGGGGGSLTVQDSLTSVSSVTTLDTRHSGLAVSTPGAGQANLSSVFITLGGSLPIGIAGGAFSITLGGLTVGVDIFSGAVYLVSVNVYGQALGMSSPDWTRLSANASAALAYSIVSYPTAGVPPAGYNISFLWPCTGSLSFVFDGNVAAAQPMALVWTASVLLVKRA